MSTLLSLLESDISSNNLTRINAQEQKVLQKCAEHSDCSVEKLTSSAAANPIFYSKLASYPLIVASEKILAAVLDVSIESGLAEQNSVYYTNIMVKEVGKLMSTMNLEVLSQDRLKNVIRSCVPQKIARYSKKKALRVLSLGGGTQSTALALMAAKNMLAHKPDVAIFADTGWEPQSVYENIEWLASELPYPLVTVNVGSSIRDDIEAGINPQGYKWLSIPVFMTKQDGTAAGMNWRQCTSKYKIVPIIAEAKKILGIKPKGRIPNGTQIEMWLGITTDEAERMKPAQNSWIENVYPLIDKNLSREDCIDWFYSEYPGRSLPRSACIGCPYHSRRGWADMLRNSPEEFADAEAVDSILRSNTGNVASLFKNRIYLHSSRKPLREAVLADIAAEQLDGQEGWGNECAGICGV